MKKLAKVIFTLAIVWVSMCAFSSVDCVQATGVTISAEEESITIKNAGLQGAKSIEFDVENAPVGAKAIITLGDEQVISFYGQDEDDNKIELFNTRSYDVGYVQHDDEDYEDDEGHYISVLPLTTGRSSIIIKVYSQDNEVLASKTIQVEVKKVTPKLYQYDSLKNKTKKLGKTAQWNAECGDWVSGSFGLRNIPYNAKVTLSVNKKNMYKYINTYTVYKWKKMKKNSYTMKANPYEYGDSYAFSLYPIKKGNAKIKVTIEANGEKTTFVIKNKVIAYNNPLEKLVINGKNKAKLYNKMQYLRTGTNLETNKSLDMYRTKSENMTGQIKMKKGYKLVSVKNGKKNVKLTQSNGTYYFSVPVSQLSVLKITYKDKKGKIRYLYNKEV